MTNARNDVRRPPIPRDALGRAPDCAVLSVEARTRNQTVAPLAHQRRSQAALIPAWWLIAAGMLTPPARAGDVSFATQIQPIFDAHCVTCHQVGGLADQFGIDLKLNVEQSCDNLLNQTSVQNPALRFVMPGNSTDSLLFLKVSLDLPPVGIRMPFGGPPLSEDDIALIEAWIDGGAECCVADGDCDDGNACTDNVCSGGDCETTPNSADCDDSDPCTEDDVCDAGDCTGTPIVNCASCVTDADCGDANVCTDDECSAGVCQHPANTFPCDDVDPCTDNDACSAGVCLGVLITNCVACVNNATCSDGNVCTDDICSNGVCQSVPNTVLCDDNDPCSTNDVCSGGLCDGVPIEICCEIDQQCDDTNECTVDDCVGGSCVHTPIPSCISCDDDSNCNDANMCTSDVCTDGVCEHIDNSAPCDDGDPCTDGDACVEGECTGAPIQGCCEANDDCDDDDPCTEDLCSEGTCAQVAIPGCATCETDADCDDADPCTEDACTGMVCDHMDSDVSCDDGDPCTNDDSCSGGNCSGIPMADCCTIAGDCDDDEPCTEDACVANRCTHEAIEGCEDTGEDDNAAAPLPEDDAQAERPSRSFCGIIGMVNFAMILTGLVGLRASRRGTHKWGHGMVPWGYGLVLMVGVVVAAGEGGPSNGHDTLPTLNDGKVNYEYVGTKKCRSCHSQWHKSWNRLPKGRSWDALKPGMGLQVKRRVGLDITADYRSDSRCLVCHSVGFGHKTGYAVPDPDDGRSVRFARMRQGVGCEACHGPGSSYTQLMRDIFWNRASYSQEDLHAAGLRKITQEDCLRCHSTDAQCIVSDGKGGTHPLGAIEIDLTNSVGFHKRFPIESVFKMGVHLSDPRP